MISIVQPLNVGNALRVFIEPPAGAVRWKVLRKAANSFSGPDDPSALLVYEGDDKIITDAESIANGIMQFYCPYYSADGITWTAGTVGSGTANATYTDQTTDVMSELRARLEAGLKVECERGTFATELGYIQVYTAPPAMEPTLRFPLLTLHMEGEEPGERFIGEEVASDSFDAIGFDIEESEGWLANVRVQIIAWSLNSDERLELRKAIRRLVIANLPVFDGFGWSTINLSQQDADALSGEYGAPVYQVMNTFTCLAPARVTSNVDAIRDVISRSILNE